ncbi:MAG: tetratricopeptide repeat protein [Akkermansiaceae bacterium]|jgi:tetratricopeptide (TPR) repeat protein
MPEITDKELPQSSRAYWLKALAAVEVKNHAYAVTLLQAILKDSPGFLAGRELMRKCQGILTGGPKKKQKIFGLDAGGPGMKLQGAAKKDPVSAVLLIEKELEKDPYNDGLNDLLHDCLAKMELFDSAAFALETVRKGHPDNTKSMHKLAIFYLERGRADLAGDVYNDILKTDPTDGKAVKGAKDCAAQHSMQRQNWSENSSVKDLMKDQSEFQELEASSRAGMTKDQMFEKRDRLIARYNEDPNHLGNAKELANIFEQLEDWENAATFYDWAFSLSNGDAALKAKGRQMSDKFISQQMAALQAAVEADPDNVELRAQLDEVLKARAAEMVANAKQRVEENPTDPQLRFELGSALYNAGDFSAAIPHLQQAKSNPHIRTKVLLLLGRTFKAKSMFDLSLKQLSDALADLHGMDNTKKEVLYDKGLIHGEMGDKESALDCFKQIYEVDYGYRDVAHRVESSYS